MLGKSPNQ
jgi:IS5 family transposase